MPSPLTFTSASPRFSLPFLFAGQAQKELTVNEAHALADALLHCAIEGESTSPPATPSDGENWLVGAGASAEWAGQDGSIACRQAGTWLFVTPRDGIRILDRSTGQEIRYIAGWQTPSTPAAPAGGATIDAEARTAISALVSALQAAGVFPSS